MVVNVPSACKALEISDNKSLVNELSAFFALEASEDNALVNELSAFVALLTSSLIVFATLNAKLASLFMASDNSFNVSNAVGAKLTTDAIACLVKSVDLDSAATIADDNKDSAFVARDTSAL